MDRRRFTRLFALTAGSTALPGFRFPTLHGSPAVDAARLAARMTRLAGFGANDAGGIDRVAFGDADLAARAWIRGLMDDAGLATHVDLAGNLVGRREGTDPTLPPLSLGSHVDSVPGGGNFDGQVGSMGALEVACALHDADHRTRHPLEFLIFCNEEGGKTGSRALAGEVDPSELELPTASGHTIGQGVARLGGDPARLAQARRPAGSLTAFLELHVEQGAILDADGIDIGVVEGIVGIERWNVTVEGMTNHAGTTPMDRRRDAMVAAARFVDVVHRSARSIAGRQVATVGRIEVEPGAPNVIPGRVTLSLEIRDLTMDGIHATYDTIWEQVPDLAEATGTTFTSERFYVSKAAPTHPVIRDVVERAARAAGLSTLRMPSGAGHDAQSMALLAPVGMIFVPSAKGISHAPDEFTEAEDVTRGTRLLLDTLLALDEGVGLG
ncbi:MAG: Zn-dependent hydrolase [Gemmatimonadota bacterium]|nr:Zn-dependent hydrolase [Gemmatimonadota bacterium]MDH5759217.1 Zn-dependent hydrolase [Gemmatimonadota bacterium]